MRSTIRVLVCVFLFLCCSVASLQAESPVCATGLSTSAGLTFSEKPVLRSSCNVNRNCQYGVPSNVYCSSPNGVCSSGPEDYGWVECDGVRQYCSPPAQCTGTCFSTLQCYSICGAGGTEPALYQCDSSAHCCRCYYY